MLIGEATGKSVKPFQRADKADFSTQQRPQKISLSGQKSQPGLAIGDQMKVGSSAMALDNANGFVADKDRSLFWFLSGKREMIGRLKALGLSGLED